MSVGTTCLLLGCVVDDRKLVPPALHEVGAMAGAAGSSSADAWQGCGDGGASGAPDKSQCWGFDQGVEGWVVESGVVVSLSADDASLDPASGSLSVVNEDVGKDDQLETAGVYQCLPIPYSNRYALELEALVPSQPVAGGASVELEFVNVPGCEGIILGHPQFADPKALAWQRITGGGDVPRGARSVRVRLLVDKFHNDPRVEALFDQIRLTFE